MICHSLVYTLLQEAQKYHASDVHIGLTIYFRINKQMFPYPLEQEDTQGAYIESIKKELCLLINKESYSLDTEHNIPLKSNKHHYNEISQTLFIYPSYNNSLSAESAKQMNTNSAAQFASKLSLPIKCRVSAFLQEDNLCFALRLFQTQIPSLEELKSPQALRDLALQDNGLVLICGATSSGKSTTIAAMIHHINTHARKHILTIEDPIEYTHTNIFSYITQRQIGRDSKDFNTALTSSLRQDPDVIIIGEILDSEVLKQAINHALSGHLVISSFHAKNATHAISRILGMCHNDGNIHANLADCLQGIITQRLYEREQKLESDYEILVANPAVRILIKENKIHQLDSQISMGREFGMRHFAQK